VTEPMIGALARRVSTRRWAGPLLGLCVLLPSEEGRALTGELSSRPVYAWTSSNGEWILVRYHVPCDPGEFIQGSAETATLRSRYPSDGLYRTRPPYERAWTPVWSVPQHEFWFEVANDGVHVVALRDWTTHPWQEVLYFYASGRQVRSYRVWDLVDFWVALPWPLVLNHLSGNIIPWKRDGTIVEDQSSFSLWTESCGWTQLSDWTLFDLRTGAVRETFHPNRTLRNQTYVILASTLLLVFALRARSRRHRRQAR
jgi:hypothetical protein